MKKFLAGAAVVSGMAAMLLVAVWILIGVFGLPGNERNGPPRLSRGLPLLPTILPASTPQPADPSVIAPIPVSVADILGEFPRGPDRDLYDLARRLRGQVLPASSGNPPLPTTITDPVGARRQFWVTNLQDETHFQIDAELRVLGKRAAMWVADDLDVSNEDLQRSLEDFETLVYPFVMDQFAGADIFADIAGPMIVILNARIPGVAGYYSESDAYPAEINQFSNEMTMFYMSGSSVRPGSRRYTSVLTHEFQHMVHAYVSPSEQVWLNEGLSELATDLAGFGQSAFVRSFVGNPKTQLNSWSDTPSGAGAHYGAAYLFVRYLYERFGDTNPTSNLVLEQATGLAGVQNYLSGVEPASVFDQVFSDWLLANRLDRPETGFGYQGVDVKAATIRSLEPGLKIVDRFPQFAGAYYAIGGDVEQIVFNGAPEVNLAPVSASSADHFWWGNRGDAMNTFMQREFDLRDVESATLNFLTWYEIEEKWDFGYVSVSGDGGRSWTVVRGRRSVVDDPLGTSFGPGLTGAVSAAWFEESMDLTPFAGKRVIVRFDYVTDEAVNLTGWLIDDIEIPEIDYFDDVESDGGWITEGFIRTNGRLPQLYTVQLYGVSRDGVERIAFPVDARGEAVIDVGRLREKFDEIEIVVAGMTPVTSQPAVIGFTVK